MLCFECGSSSYIYRIQDKDICEKCMIWYEDDEENEEHIDEYEYDKYHKDDDLYFEYEEIQIELIYPGDLGYDDDQGTDE